MLTQLKTSPVIRQKLQGLGYADEQIPDWIAEAASEAEQVPDAAKRYLMLRRGT
jgi:hypothetical protein